MLNEMRGFFYVYINQYFINEHSSISGAKRPGKLFKFIAWYYGAVRRASKNIEMEIKFIQNMLLILLIQKIEQLQSISSFLKLLFIP